MEIPRDQQIRFAKELLPLLEVSRDPETLDRLHNLASLVLEWSGFSDNGVAFDLNEYSFELKELASGKDDTGWAKEAKASLDKQLGETS